MTRHVKDWSASTQRFPAPVLDFRLESPFDLTSLRLALTLSFWAILEDYMPRGAQAPLAHHHWQVTKNDHHRLLAYAHMLIHVTHTVSLIQCKIASWDKKKTSDQGGQDQVVINNTFCAPIARTTTPSTPTKTNAHQDLRTYRPHFPQCTSFNFWVFVFWAI